MDFAAILSAEISKKRKTAPKTATATTTTATRTNTSTDTADAGVRPKKYVKRSEVEAQRQAEYERRQHELAEQRAQRAAEKRAEEAAVAQQREEARERQRKLAEERRQRQTLGAATGGEAKATSDNTSAAVAAAAAASGGGGGGGAGAGGDGQDMTEAEAVEKLRAMGQPARLFGESATGRIKRCRRLAAARGAAAAVPGEGDVSAGAMTEAEMRVELADVSRDPARVYRQLDAWFRLVLREWRCALDERPLAVKESFLGRKAAEAMAQADAYMQPLFRHFRLNDLRPIVFEKVCEIVVEAQRRRYVKANDVYLKLSIGNACVSILALRRRGDET